MLNRHTYFLKNVNEDLQQVSVTNFGLQNYNPDFLVVIIAS